MPFDEHMESIRPLLVEAWNERQAMNRRQMAQFMEIIQPAVEAYLRKAGFQTIIMRLLGQRRGKFSATKWSGSIPLDGEILEGHTASYAIDQYTAGFNGKDNVPGFRNQLTGRAGDATIIITVSVCRDEDRLYHVVHLTHVDAFYHNPTHFYFDSREMVRGADGLDYPVDLELWLVVMLSACDDQLNDKIDVTINSYWPHP